MIRYYEMHGKVVRHQPGGYEVWRDGGWSMIVGSRVAEDGIDITEEQAREMVEKEGGSLDGNKAESTDTKEPEAGEEEAEDLDDEDEDEDDAPR